MPRYYFETDDGSSRVIDDDGIELRDAEAARREAVLVLPAMAHERLLDTEACTLSAIVRNEDGAIVYTATMTFIGSRIDARTEPSVQQVWRRSA